jgi:hypothetical protein
MAAGPAALQFWPLFKITICDLKRLVDALFKVTICDLERLPLEVF